MNDPNAEKTRSRLNAIQKTCRDSGLLNKRLSSMNSAHVSLWLSMSIIKPLTTLFVNFTRKSYVVKSNPRYNTAFVSICRFFILEEYISS